MEPLDDEPEFTRIEVIGQLWTARDLAVGGRWLSLLIGVAGFASAYVVTNGESIPGWPPWLVACIGSSFGVAGIVGAVLARRHQTVVAPLAWSVPALVTAVGGSETLVRHAWLSITLELAGLFAAYVVWREMRGKLLRAQGLAARHPELQAARAWRGEPAVRDPYRT